MAIRWLFPAFSGGFVDSGESGPTLLVPFSHAKPFCRCSQVVPLAMMLDWGHSSIHQWHRAVTAGQNTRPAAPHLISHGAMSPLRAAAMPRQTMGMSLRYPKVIYSRRSRGVAKAASERADIGADLTPSIAAGLWHSLLISIMLSQGTSCC